MRKTSQDGGDNTSITSGVENEIKKPIVGIIKTKRNSIKRKVQSFSHESDDAVIEPLLQKEKDNTDISNQSAKHLLPKTKTESSSEKGDDRDKLLSDDRVEKPSLSNAPSAIGSTTTKNGTKETIHHQPKLYECSSTLHNHMNTNIFGSHDGVKNIITPKSQILVEIDSKNTGYNPSPLIFTTAKIHTDGKTKQMEPVQVTPVPILSTIESSCKIGVKSSDKIISGVTNIGNNIQSTKTSASISNSSHSAVLCILPNNMQPERKDEIDSKKLVTSSNILTNNLIKPVVSVDINTIPTKTIKSDLNTVAHMSCSFDNKKNCVNMDGKELSKTSESFVDVNKNIEIDRTISSNEELSDNTVGTTSLSYIDKKQLLMAKNAKEQDKNRSLKSYVSKNDDSRDKKESVEKVNIEPRKVEMSSESSVIKTNENISLPKYTAVSTCMSSNSVSSVNYTLTSPKTCSVQTLKDKLHSQNPSITQVPGTTNPPTTLSGSTITSKPTISTSTSLASKPVSTSSKPANSTITNIISTQNTKLLKDLPSLKSATTEVSKKPIEISNAKISVTTSSPKIKSTVSTIISAPKPAAIKNVLPTPSVKNSTNVIKTSSAQPSVSTNTVSVVSTAVDSISNNAIKPVISVHSKPNNVTKTVSSTVDPGKSFYVSQKKSVPCNSSETNSEISTAKGNENSTQGSKSTPSISKPSTSIKTSKPSTESSALPSNSTKPSSTKTSSTKSNSGTVSSVKTLITSSDKPSSNGGSIKLSTKSSNKIEPKKVDGKKA